MGWFVWVGLWVELINFAKEGRNIYTTLYIIYMYIISIGPEGSTRRLLFFISSGGWVKRRLKLPHFHVSDTCRVSI